MVKNSNWCSGTIQKNIDENPDSTKKELGQLYGDASHPIVCRAIKKLDIHIKRKHLLIKKEMK